ncbi:MAG: hypothetical protein C4326_10495 [Ignavibacteria bacterium]
MTRTAREQANNLSISRRRVFFILTILFPFVLLAILESLLRLIDYGGDLHLVVERKLGDKVFYSINRSVARRYFAQAGTIVPEPADDLFEIVKSKNTKRIFCLGESTMAGFPYEFNATAPSFLRDRLQTLLPHYKIEVINVGLSAVGSFVVLDFIDELMAYEPDLFILYVGHNEFYGAFGAASRVALGGSSFLTRTALMLLRFKIVLLARDLYVAMRNLFTPSHSASDNATLMGQMVGEQGIRYGNPLYQRTHEAYMENLERILDAAQSHRVPILVSTLVSNLKDHPPFQSVFAEHADERTKAEWRRLLDMADSLAERRHFTEAIALYRKASLLDTMHAETFFKLARLLYAASRFDEAKEAFLRAKDLDALRFRMSEEFQRDLMRICTERGVALARPDSSFAVHSPHGIVGNELILEHLHPTIAGYFLMAKTWCRTLISSRLLVPQNEWRFDLDTSDVEYLRRSTVSAFDSTVGRLKVELLMRKWPFQRVDQPWTFSPHSPVEDLAYRYIQGRIGWSDARYALAEAYAKQGRFEQARNECLAVWKVIPFSYNPLLRVGDYYAREGKMAEAKATYWRCVQTEDNPFGRMKLGWRYLEEEKPDSALQQLLLAFQVNERFHDKLTLQGAATGRYLLGVAYAKIGNISEAQHQLERAIAIQPEYADAQELLQQLKALHR